MSDLTVNDLFKGAEFDVDCPDCGINIKFYIGDMGTTIKCPACQCPIKIQASDKPQQQADNVNQALKAFENKLKNLKI